jgi:integrase
MKACGSGTRVIVSLLIYQALRLKEVAQLRLKDIDLEAGTVYTKGMAKTLPTNTENETQTDHAFLQVYP